MRLIASYLAAPIIFRTKEEVVFGSFFGFTLRSFRPPAGQSFRCCHGLKDTIRRSLDRKLLNDIRHGSRKLGHNLTPTVVSMPLRLSGGGESNRDYSTA